MFSYEGYKKTNLRTYTNGRYRLVYEKDGKLYYRLGNCWHGTFRNYCEEQDKMYEVVYSDENFETFFAGNDEEAWEEAEKYVDEHGIVFDIFELDVDYNRVRTVF